MTVKNANGWLQLILVILFILGAFIISRLMETEYEAPKSNNGASERVLFAQTKNIKPVSYRIKFGATGVVEAKSNIDIISQVSGRIISVSENFFRGGHFSKKEILFEIDPRDFQLAVEAQKAEVAKARRAFNIEQAESQAAIEEWRLANGDEKPPLLVARKPQIDEAWANLEAAKASFEQANLDLERTKFSLPFDGIVLESSIGQGQYITSGQAYGQVFNKQDLEVKVSLQDQQLEWLLSTPNPEINITTSYRGETRTYKGVLKRSASSIEADTRFASLRFGFADEASPDLLPGVFADIEIHGPNLNNVMVLPAEALQVDGQIWVIKDNKFKAWEPEIIYSDDNNIVVRAEADQTIELVVSRVSGVTSDTSVAIQNSEKQTAKASQKKAEGEDE